MDITEHCNILAKGNYTSDCTSRSQQECTSAQKGSQSEDAVIGPTFFVKGSHSALKNDFNPMRANIVIIAVC